MSDTDTAADAPLFEGILVRIGERELTMPPLSFAALKTAAPALQSLSAPGGARDAIAAQDAFVDIVHSALRRNYPALPRDEVEQSLDWRIATRVVQLLMQLSVPADPSGEPTGASPSGASTGIS